MMDTILEKLRKASPGIVKVRLTKLSEVENPVNPNNREVGEVNLGYGSREVNVGQRYSMYRSKNLIIKMSALSGSIFSTSTVQKIISVHHAPAPGITFRTHNSIYELEILPDEYELEASARGLGEGISEGPNVSEGDGTDGISNFHPGTAWS